MNKEEQAKVLNALFGYKALKIVANDPRQQVLGVYVPNKNGGRDHMDGEQIARAVLLSEEVHKHFKRVDEVKGKFVELYFFRRINRVRITHELSISRSTVFEWRRDIIEIAEKIAREIAFI